MGGLMVLTRDEKQHLLQSKLVEMTRLACEACELGLDLGIDRVDFMGGMMIFAIDGEPSHDRSPLMTKAEWSSSNFGCYPSDEEWTWFHGENPPPKPYDNYEL